PCAVGVRGRGRGLPGQAGAAGAAAGGDRARAYLHPRARAGGRAGSVRPAHPPVRAPARQPAADPARGRALPAGGGEVRGGPPRPRRGPDRGVAEITGGRVRRAVPAHPPQLPGLAPCAGGTAARPRRPGARAAAPCGHPAGGQPPLRGPRARGDQAAVKPPAARRGDNGRMKTVRIATRKSPLALWQSEHVATLLRNAYPDLEVSLVPLSTRGDEILDRSLSAIGGKGLFLKELE